MVSKALGVLFLIFAFVTSTMVFGTPSISQQALSVCVYYDAPVDRPNYQLGHIYAVMMRNLLGHFQEVQPKLIPIREYQSRSLFGCDRVAYFGSYYDSPTPESFYNDLSLYKRPVLWSGYNIWNLQTFMGPSAFSRKTGFEFLRLFQYSKKPNPPVTEAGFYKYFDYKGQRFHKLDQIDHRFRKHHSHVEIGLIKKELAEVLSWAEDNHTGLRTPYITAYNDFFYVADIPFSYIHESDRYLIFSDLLFDFLKLPPRHSVKKALVRIEDIHPSTDLRLLYLTLSKFKKYHIPFLISVIPKFVDPFGYLTGVPQSKTLKQNPPLVKALRYAENLGGEFVLHGFTHQLDQQLNCETGASGSDHEFWDGCLRRPLAFESETWVLERIYKAIDHLHDAGLEYVAWLPPHYEASPLAYKMFAKVFPATIQRVRYTPDGADPGNPAHWGGQFFPYEIYQDYYGQRIWPENLGNVRISDKKERDIHVRSTEDILESIRLNSVIRDSWASFFWHSQIVDTEEGLASLDRILKEIHKYGYQFVSLSELNQISPTNPSHHLLPPPPTKKP
ncbi:MAG: DUF2334 domain-containing protein [Bdellovibrionales bacterium]|nr:DUF2334 domain-containing protein [Bdellovibrionales bacterium]